MSDKKNTRGSIDITESQQELLNKIGKRVKELREKKLDGMSYEEFASKYGLNRTSQYRLESGQNFMMVNLMKFCEGVGVSLKEFFAGIK